VLTPLNAGATKLMLCSGCAIRQAPTECTRWFLQGASVRP
jgi:hypothetical protein